MSWHEEPVAENSFAFKGEGISDLWHAIQATDLEDSGSVPQVKHFYNTTGLKVCESETTWEEWLTGLRKLTF